MAPACLRTCAAPPPSAPRDVGAQLRSAGPLAFTGEFSDRRSDDYATARAGRLANSDTAARNGSIGTSWIFDNGYVGIGGNRFESEYGIPSSDRPRIDLARNRIEVNGEFSGIAGLERLRLCRSQQPLSPCRDRRPAVMLAPCSATTATACALTYRRNRSRALSNRRWS